MAEVINDIFHVDLNAIAENARSQGGHSSATSIPIPPEGLVQPGAMSSCRPEAVTLEDALVQLGTLVTRGTSAAEIDALGNKLREQIARHGEAEVERIRRDGEAEVERIKRDGKVDVERIIRDGEAQLERIKRDSAVRRAAERKKTTRHAVICGIILTILVVVLAIIVGISTSRHPASGLITYQQTGTNITAVLNGADLSSPENKSAIRFTLDVLMEQGATVREDGSIDFGAFNVKLETSANTYVVSSAEVNLDSTITVRFTDPNLGSVTV